jgi:uncharacterized protein YuzE
MKKQLLIAAVAATMASATFADVSITGASKFNVKNEATSYSTDIMIAGKAGDTTVNYKLKMSTTGFETETATVSTSVSGVNLKVGAWKSGANELDQESGTAVTRYNASTTMGGVKVTVEADDDTGVDVSVSGSIAGVSISHKESSNDSSETTIGGSFGGVDFSVNQEEAANGDKNTATTVSTTMSGITLKYVDIDTDAGTVSDGYVLNGSVVAEASAFGISTKIGGNTVTFKKIDIDGTDNTKVIITRPLNGATFEATYDDNAETLDLELAVKF